MVEQMTRNLKLEGSNNPEVENGREFFKKGSTMNFLKQGNKTDNGNEEEENGNGLTQGDKLNQVRKNLSPIGP